VTSSNNDGSKTVIDALLRSNRSNHGSEHLDIGSALTAIRRHWVLAIAVASAVILAASFYAAIASPIYLSNALIKVDVVDESKGSIPPSMSGLIAPKSSAAAEIEMLRSRAVVSEAIDKTGLAIIAKPKYFPLLGAAIARSSHGLSTPGLFGMDGYVWGTESIEVRYFEVPDSLKKKTFTLTVEGLDKYTLKRGDALVLRGQLSSEYTMELPEGPLRILVDAFNARRGSQFILQNIFMSDAVEDLQKHLIIEEQGRQSGVISVALKSPDPQTGAAVLNELSEQYLRQNASLRSNQADKQLSFLEAQLPQLKATAEAAEANYSRFRNKNEATDLTEEIKSALQKSLQAQKRLVELRQDRDELRTRLGYANPELLALNSQIETQENEVASIDSQLRRVPATEQDVARLTREVSVATELYKTVLTSTEQLKLLKASQLGSAVIVDAAVPTATPVGPKRKLIVLAGLGAGLLMGAFAALLRKTFTGSIENQFELLDGFGVPVDAVIPHSANRTLRSRKPSKKLGRTLLLAQAVEDEGAIESLRALRSSYQLSTLGSKNKVISIVGPTPGVGKSFVAANLSAVLSGAGKRILLIDADLRAGCLHRHFGVDPYPGFSDLITTNVPAANVIHTGVLPNMDFISTGTEIARPSDALDSGRLALIFKYLSAKYDFVVVDSAPALVVVDPLIIARHAARIFCVTRRGKTTTEQIAETLKRFKQSGYPITSFIFNDARPTDVSYGYNYPYGNTVIGAKLDDRRTTHNAEQYYATE
jgi:tyrosine-protein kinase Etk/Wzc